MQSPDFNDTRFTDSENATPQSQIIYLILLLPANKQYAPNDALPKSSAGHYSIEFHNQYVYHKSGIFVAPSFDLQRNRHDDK